MGLATLLRLVMVTLLLSVITGCTSLFSPAPSPTPPGTVLLWKELAAFDISGFADSNPETDKPRLVVIGSLQDTAQLEGHVYPEVLKSVRQVDFSRYIVLGVFRGFRGTTGYGVEVDDVRLDSGEVVVYARFTDPPKNEVLGQLVTSPYVLLRVERGEQIPHGSVVFVLVVNGSSLQRITVELP